MVEIYEDSIRTPLPFCMMTKSSTKSPNPRLSPSSPSRLWRPAAQRNIKNQWSKLLLTKDRWDVASSHGRSHATNLVNAYLEQMYMPERSLGVLKDMPKIREEACSKLAYNQGLFRYKLVSSYKDLVVAVNDLVKTSYSMRCYLKGSGSSPIIRYSDLQDDPNDSGDGGGIPVFVSLSITNFEDLARELVCMFRQELSLKRFLVICLLSIDCVKGGDKDGISVWSDELYDGEFDDLTASGMLIQDSYPFHPQIKDFEPSDTLNRVTAEFAKRETLEVFLVTWINDLNIDIHRVNEMFSIAHEETRAKLS